MQKNRLCGLLGIRYPIIQAPMNWVSGADLVAAVSNAGGLGTSDPMPVAKPSHRMWGSPVKDDAAREGR